MAKQEQIEKAQDHYRAAITGDQAEFVAAKVALVELSTGRQLSEDEIAYL